MIPLNIRTKLCEELATKYFERKVVFSSKYGGVGIFYYTKFRTFLPVFDVIEPIAEVGYAELEKIDETS